MEQVISAPVGWVLVAVVVLGLLYLASILTIHSNTSSRISKTRQDRSARKFEERDSE